MNIKPIALPCGQIWCKLIIKWDVENFQKFQGQNVESLRNSKTTLPISWESGIEIPSKANRKLEVKLLDCLI
jgi:hypothetical protein